MKWPTRRIVGWCAVGAVAATALAVPLLRWRRDQIIKAKLAKVESDWHALLSAMQSLGVDNCNCYLPADTAWRDVEEPTLGAAFFNTNGGSPLYAISLTTPIAYISELPTDPFRPHQGYGFISWHYVYHGEPSLALLHSPGPDGVFDVRLARLYALIQAHFEVTAQDAPTGGGRLDYTPKTAAYAQLMISAFQYDPTNGLMSRGDLIGVFAQCADGPNFGFSMREWEGRKTATLPEDVTLASLLERFPADAKIPQPRYKDEPVNLQELVVKYASLPVERAFFERFEPYIKAYVGDNAEPDPLANKLSAFGDFFERPGALGAERHEKLKAWRLSDADWWNRIEQGPPPVSPDKVPLNKERFAKFFVYYGKSRLLLAASKYAEGAPERGNSILAALEDDVETLRGGYGPNAPEPLATRVHSEMLRMAGALRREAGQILPFFIAPDASESSAPGYAYKRGVIRWGVARLDLRAALADRPRVEDIQPGDAFRLNLFDDLELDLVCQEAQLSEDGRRFAVRGHLRSNPADLFDMNWTLRAEDTENNRAPRLDGGHVDLTNPRRRFVFRAEYYSYGIFEVDPAILPGELSDKPILPPGSSIRARR